MDRLASLRRFLEALHRKDLATARDYLADDVSIASPIIPEPFRGKAQVTGVLEALDHVIDAFDVREVLCGEEQFAVYVSIRADDIVIDAMDYTVVDDDGRVAAMTVMWRPLPAVVRMQQRLATLLEIPKLSLVETPSETASAAIG